MAPLESGGLQDCDGGTEMRLKGNFDSPSPPVACHWSNVTFRTGLHLGKLNLRHLIAETLLAIERVVRMLTMIKRYSVTCQRVSAWQCCMGGVAFLWERVNFGPRQNKNHPTDQDQIWQA
jgi:hypothetical protein